MGGSAERPTARGRGTRPRPARRAGGRATNARTTAPGGRAGGASPGRGVWGCRVPSCGNDLVSPELVKLLARPDDGPGRAVDQDLGGAGSGVVGGAHHGPVSTGVQNGDP